MAVGPQALHVRSWSWWTVRLRPRRTGIAEPPRSRTCSLWRSGTARWRPPTLFGYSGQELRRRNTNRALKAAETRSAEAQRVVEQYGEANVPKNASLDALHADHVYPLTEAELHQNDTLERWIGDMPRLQMVVCVTADENYRLEACEKRGVTGPRKYAQAGVTFTTSELPWQVDALDALKLEDVPTTTAPWEQIAQFAETFDGYAHLSGDWGERMSATRDQYFANGDLPTVISDLRGCLFCEFRGDRFAWGDDVMLSEPDAQEVRHIVANPDFVEIPDRAIPPRDHRSHPRAARFRLGGRQLAVDARLRVPVPFLPRLLLPIAAHSGLSS